MTKFLLIVIAVLSFLLLVFVLLFIIFKKQNQKNKELYKQQKERNTRLAEYIDKMDKARAVVAEERKNAEEKIQGAWQGSDKERFDYINNVLANGDGLREQRD